MIKFDLIVIAISALFSIMFLIDFVVYAIRKSPKSTVFARRTWWIGMTGLCIVLYWIMNGGHF